jgi:hypothetical protein
VDCRKLTTPHLAAACLGIAPAWLATTPRADAQILYSQPPVPSAQGLISQDARNPGGMGWFAEVADNFTASAAWNIGRVEFWGAYQTPSGQPGHTRGFTIRFYSNAGGMPGTLLFQRDLSTFSETEVFAVGPLAGYAYSVTLSPPFTLPAPGTYFLSVVAILDAGGSATEPQWGWIRSGGLVPPTCRQWVFFPGQFTPQDHDVSFVLHAGSAACYPDCNGDGVLGLADFGCYQTRFALQDPYADCNGDGLLNLADFGCFQTRFALGCP